MQQVNADDIGKALNDAAHGFIDPSREQLQYWLDAYYPHAHDRQAWLVLHCAAMQVRGSSTLILELAWASPLWKPLFNDPTYLDKYGCQVWEQISHPMGSTILSRAKIYKEANREQADKLRKFLPMPEQEIKQLMEEQFDYLSAPVFHLLHKAAYRDRADQFLELAWQSEKWRPLFNRVCDDRTVFQALQDALDNSDDLELEERSCQLRVGILNP